MYHSYLGCRAIDDMNADILKYYSTGIDAPLCPALTHVTKSCDAACVHQLIDDWLIELPDGKTTMWQASTIKHSFVCFLSILDLQICRQNANIKYMIILERSTAKYISTSISAFSFYFS